MPAGGGGGTTYDLASAQDGNNVDITLTPATGAVDTVQLTAGSGITLTDNGSNNITIDAAAGGSGLWTATGNDIYNNNSNAVVIGKTTAAADATSALEVSGRVSQVGLGDSTFFGYGAGSSTSISNKRCAAFGNFALYLNVSSFDNTAIGYQALFRTTGSGNTGVGSTAMSNNTSGNNNVAIGDDALRVSATGSSNVAVGAQSLYSVTSGANVGVGYRALEGGTTGTGNTGLGAYSLKSVDTSSYNTAVGQSALEFLASGDGRNIAIGLIAGSNYGTGASVPLTACSDSIFIGDNTRALSNGGSNEIAIGSGVLGNGSNTITLGNADNAETHLTGVIVLEGYTFATLPASPVVGMRTYITDSAFPTYYTNAAGGGTYKAPVFYDGSNWLWA
jgi:hypothetical protein